MPRAGWRDILWRVWEEQGGDNVSIVAAGVAFFGFLAIFPGLAALVSIYGLVADPVQVEQQFQAMGGLLPPEAQGILLDQARSLATAPPQGLSVGFAVSLLLTLWSASKGMTALMTALNIVYDEEERRGMVAYYATALALTLGAILIVVAMLVLVVAVPAVMAALALSGPLAWLVSLARWPILAIGLMLWLAVLYRFGPSRNQPKWRWVSWGAAVAAVVWLLGSIAFSLYVANFGSYNETYGSVAAVVVALLWFNLGTWAILIGGELNAEMERQTARDTTIGLPRPLGRREAYVADTVGPVP